MRHIVSFQMTCNPVSGSSFNVTVPLPDEDGLYTSFYHRYVVPKLINLLGNATQADVVQGRTNRGTLRLAGLPVIVWPDMPVPELNVYYAPAGRARFGYIALICDMSQDCFNVNNTYDITITYDDDTSRTVSGLHWVEAWDVTDTGANCKIALFVTPEYYEFNAPYKKTVPEIYQEFDIKYLPFGFTLDRRVFEEAHAYSLVKDAVNLINGQYAVRKIYTGIIPEYTDSTIPPFYIWEINEQGAAVSDQQQFVGYIDESDNMYGLLDGRMFFGVIDRYGTPNFARIFSTEVPDATYNTNVSVEFPVWPQPEETNLTYIQESKNIFGEPYTPLSALRVFCPEEYYAGSGSQGEVSNEDDIKAITAYISVIAAALLHGNDGQIGINAQGSNNDIYSFLGGNTNDEKSRLIGEVAVSTLIKPTFAEFPVVRFSPRRVISLWQTSAMIRLNTPLVDANIPYRWLYNVQPCKYVSYPDYTGYVFTDLIYKATNELEANNKGYGQQGNINNPDITNNIIPISRIGTSAVVQIRTSDNVDFFTFNANNEGEQAYLGIIAGTSTGKNFCCQSPVNGLGIYHQYSGLYSELTPYMVCKTSDGEITETLIDTPTGGMDYGFVISKDGENLNCISLLHGTTITLSGGNNVTVGSVVENNNGTAGTVVYTYNSADNPVILLEGPFPAYQVLVTNTQQKMSALNVRLVTEQKDEELDIGSYVKLEKLQGAWCITSLLLVPQGGGHFVGTTTASFTQNSSRTSTGQVTVDGKDYTCYSPLSAAGDTITSGTRVIFQKNTNGNYEIINAEC